ncbi:MAG: class I SAM-dependent methyltransferase [Xanthobacteraceae bacterium]
MLGRHKVGYWQCRDCGSLQTDEPYWLDEAYTNSLAVSDTGAVWRCLTCRAVIWSVLGVLRMRRARLLDFGGGTGLLCRLLRDTGIDAWTCDRYSGGEYAQLVRLDIDGISPGMFGVVSMFEVFEHLPHPAEDLAKLFGLGPEVLIASTEPYSPQYDAKWWYLSPGSGQHVFFYSQRALQLMADRYGYSLNSVGTWHIFTRRPISPFRKRLLRQMLSYRLLRLSRIVIEAMPNAVHVMHDHGLSLEKTAKP